MLKRLIIGFALLLINFKISDEPFLGNPSFGHRLTLEYWKLKYDKTFRKNQSEERDYGWFCLNYFLLVFNLVFFVLICLRF